jgi:hypothetical protein
MTDVTVSEAMSALAGFQLFFLDREDRPRLNPNTANNADPPGNIGEFHVVAPRRHIADAQPLIRFNGAILVVLALIRTPVRGARRGKVEFRNGVPSQVLKSGRTVLGDCRRRDRRESDNDDCL